ncbi:MAG TPA: SBBP repeat-containing protein [Pyrinomonadaceae bacterium]|nr:SBBP repeat-containing protein [Pyrinomonadaceae bacterium]
MTHTDRTHRKTRFLPLIISGSFLALICLASSGPASKLTQTGSAKQTRLSVASHQVRGSYGRLELAFESNRGQADKTVDFLARGRGYSMLLKANEAVMVMTPPSGSVSDSFLNDAADILRLELLNSNTQARVAGEEQLPGKVNYFLGNKRENWRADVPTFRRVQYEDIYPGISLAYYGNQRQLEYDFVIEPGADPKAIELRFPGVKPKLDSRGDLLLEVGTHTVHQPRPTVYQELNGQRKPVEASYVIGAEGDISFIIGDYDRTNTLVIDPTLVYSTYFGAGAIDEARDIVVDATGNAYICGNTSSTNLLVVNAFQPTFGGGNFQGARDVFVTKINSSGTSVLYSTYLGGGGDDKCGRLALDASGNAYIAGETTSTNFPVFNAFQGLYGGGSSDGFVTKLNAFGSAVFYSTYFGGNQFDAAAAIAVDPNNNAYVTGRTTSPNLFTFNAIQPAFSGGTNADAFVTKFTSSGLAVFYSTYLGGNAGVGFDAGLGIAVDTAGSAYVTGNTSSTNFPLFNPIQNFFAGGFPDGDAFVTKFSPAGTTLAYSTYLGGGDNDVASSIAIDGNGNAYVTGSTGSSNFPVLNAFQVSYGGNGDAFLSKVNPGGTALVYSTYLGGTNNESGNDVALDSALHAHVAGTTISTNFPIFNALQGTYGGGPADAFVTKFNVAGTLSLYSTFFGGSNSDRANAIAVDPADNAYIAGSTASTNFPVFNALQPNKDVAEDAIIAKFADIPATVVQFSSSNYNVTEDCTFVTITLNRLGDLTGETSVDFSTADGTALQRTDYTIASGTVRFVAGEATKTFRALISEDAYLEASETFNIVLSNPIGGGVGSPGSATVTIVDDDTVDPPIVNPTDDANIFVRQHYHDFLSREGDTAGIAFWTNVITQCGSNQTCINNKRVDVSNAFYFENEFQQTGAYVYRVYRESFGNNQPFPNPNPDPANPGEEKKVPLYLPFMRDRARVRGGAQLAQLQLDFATLFVQRAEFLSKYPATLDGPGFVDAVLATISNDLGANLTSQRQALINLFNQGSSVTAGRANVIYRLADDNTGNPINNRALIDAEYNRAFVYTAYSGYLRRNADMPGFLFWLGQVNSAPLRDVAKQHAMVCAFITAAEYQNRFSPIASHSNSECQ